MPRPRAVHERVGFVLLVFRKDFQRARVQFRVFPARIERRHAADGQHAMLVADLRNEIAQILEESHVVRNRVAVREHPFGIFQIEMDQAGHVVPAAEIQAQDVLPEIPGKLLHLKSERVRFD